MSAKDDPQRIQGLAGVLAFVSDEAGVRRSLHLLTGDSFLERAARWIGGADKAERLKTAANADRLISSSFAGNAMAFKSFMEKLEHTSLSNLDFNELTESGIAHKLIDISREHPTWFEALGSGSFQDVKALDRKIEEISVQTSLKPRRSAIAPMVSIPLGDSIPSEMFCAVGKKGALSCDWKAVQRNAPVQQEAAHLLKASAELVEAATKSLQSTAPKPK